MLPERRQKLQSAIYILENIKGNVQCKREFELSITTYKLGIYRSVINDARR